MTQDPSTQTTEETTLDPTADQTSQSEPTQPLSEVEQLSAEVNHWKDIAYRNAAELDNFRKRVAREAQETRINANADILRSILPIIDNFEMGLEAAKVESEKSMIFIGMSMVQKQLVEFLRDFGATEIEATEKAFDPNIHEAVSQEVNLDRPEGTILRVTRKGYKLKEKLLRPTSVIVSTAQVTPQEA
jgi:molecular chaperone GrpE